MADDPRPADALEPVLPSAGPAGGAAHDDAVLPSGRTPDGGARAADDARPAAAKPAGGRPTPPHHARALVADDPDRPARIGRATAQGRLGGAVPPAYEQDDWVTVWSENPFEVLYLDYRQLGAIDAVTIEERRDVLHAFWSRKEETRSRGAGGQRDRIEQLYGREVGTYARRIETAYRRLAEPGAPAREAQALDEARRAAGRRDMQRSIELCLSDGVLSVEESEGLFQDGERVGLTREEAAEYVAAVLAERGYTSRDVRRGSSHTEVLLSTEWISPARRARDEAAAARAAERARAEREAAELEINRIRRAPGPVRVAPLKFRHGAADTLDALIDLCDQYPQEARDYFAAEVIEQWLGNAGEGAAKVAARARRAAPPGDPARALELCVRDLCRLVGRPAEPALTPTPAACVLGGLPQGARWSGRITFERRGRRMVWGTARLDPALRGVTVSPTFADDAAGAEGAVEVHVDTVDVRPGDYAAQLVIEPAGGAAVTVSLRFAVQPLTLTPDRRAVHLGMVALGAKRAATVRVGVTPAGGRLTGRVWLGRPAQGVTLDGAVRSDGCEARLVVDSRLTGPDVRYQSDVHFETNAGTVVVPVSFHVRRAADEIRRWAGALALAGGAGLSAGRALLAEDADWKLAFDGMSHGPSVAVATAALAAVAFAAGAAMRRLRRARTP